jgi:hypothetical protein
MSLLTFLQRMKNDVGQSKKQLIFRMDFYWLLTLKPGTKIYTQQFHFALPQAELLNRLNQGHLASIAHMALVRAALDLVILWMLTPIL